jgi:hypothetical protein
MAAGGEKLLSRKGRDKKEVIKTKKDIRPPGLFEDATFLTEIEEARHFRNRFYRRRAREMSLATGSEQNG